MNIFNETKKNNITISIKYRKKGNQPTKSYDEVWKWYLEKTKQKTRRKKYHQTNSVKRKTIEEKQTN